LGSTKTFGEHFPQFPRGYGPGSFAKIRIAQFKKMIDTVSKKS